MNAPTIRPNGNGGRVEAKKQALSAPAVRLAYTESVLSPDVRLAWFDIPAVNQTLAAPTLSPTVRLAHKDSAQGENCLFPQIDPRHVPALLVSYVYAGPFLANRDAYCYRDWMMDSGAYSAWNTGVTIGLERYTNFALQMLAADPSLTEVIALDVINDGKQSKDATGRASLANALAMKEAGVDVVPVFHFGEDFGILREYCNVFHKVGLSCRFGEKENYSFSFYDQCFAREWPKKFHSFGWISDSVMRRYPFHSGDSTSWEAAPCAFGNWAKYGSMSVRGSSQDLRSQVQYYIDMEAKARVQWAKEMAELERLPGAVTRRPTNAPEGDYTF